MDINVLLMSKHFSQYQPREIINNNRTKIVKYSYYSINETNICYKISNKIPYYQNFFSILTDYKELNISQLEDSIIKQLKDIETKYYLFKYSEKNSIDFIDYIYNAKSVKKLLFDIINAFEHLLYGLHLLNENKICFFDITPKNIIFLSNYREKPVLSNFKFSLDLEKLDYTYFSHILKKLDDYTYQPFEIHLLYYFVNHHMVTISHGFIEEFCEDFVEKLHILRLFSDDYRKKYKEQCIETMNIYINRPRKDIIHDLLERKDKWDIYGISMLFIQLFASMSRVFTLKGTFVSEIVLVLSRNLHPNSYNRMSLEETLNIFNKHLNNERNWSFVNKLDDTKLEDLFNDFSG